MGYTTTQFNQTIELQIRFNDIDILGHVNNVSIQEFFDLGRIKYLNESLGDMMNSKYEHLVIASYNTTFFSQILFEDKIEVRTKIYKIGNKSLRMYQAIFDESQVLKASNDCVLVGFNFSTQQSIIIPEAWRDVLISFEKGDIIQDKAQ